MADPPEQQELSFELRLPAVIDDEMLTKMVYDQGPREFAGKIARDEGIDFADVKQLRLDYKNILQIDNLWCFKTLTRLQLDNNLIEKIENLEELTNLAWLDLSFNNIEKMEGLSALVNLEDLILFNNRIEVIENIDTLECLQVLSIGNNCIKELESLIYLRRFKSLQTLNLVGNPICDLETYTIYLSAMLRNLVYLDHFLVDPAKREQGLEKFDIALQKLDEEEAADALIIRVEQEKQAHYEYGRAAFVENLDEGRMFDLMYEDEDDIKKLAEIDFVHYERNKFREQFSLICQSVYDFGVAQYEERKIELQQMRDCVEQAIFNSRERGTELIAEFLDYKNQTWPELVELTTETDQTKLLEYIDKTKELKDTLTGDEMLLVNQIEEILREFEMNVREEISGLLEFSHGELARCRDIEILHHEHMSDLVDRITTTTYSDDVQEIVGDLISDKEALIALLTTSHDLHTLRIDTREDAIARNSSAWVSAIIDDMHEHAEHQRNRERVMEINHFIDYHLDDAFDLQNMLALSAEPSGEVLDDPLDVAVDDLTSTGD